jgi:CHASE2 domain-containing sensor protein/predicted Ser/Thr protein kinase
MAVTDSQVGRHRLLAGATIGLLCWALFAIAHVTGLSEVFDLRLLDLKFQLRGERPATGAFALVGVDDETIRGYGGWPLPRDAYALLLAALEEGGARAIGVDLQFPTDRNQLPEWNGLLAHVSGSHENIVHAMWFHAQSGDEESARQADGAVAILRRHGASLDEPQIARGASVALPFEELLESSPHLGHVSVAVDPDGAIRRVPLFVRYGDRSYPALAVTLFGVERIAPAVPTIRRRRGSKAIHWADGTSIPVQLDREGATGIDYAGDREAFPDTYSMLEILQWYRDGELERLRTAFKGRTVLLGLTSREEASEDVGATPFSVATPLVYVHANLYDNLARGRFLSRPATTVYLAELAILALAMGVGLAAIAIPVGAVVTAGTTIFVAAGLQAALAISAIDIPTLAPLVTAPLIYAGTGAYRYLFLERRSRMREAEIREGLSVQQQFLPEALIGKRVSRYRVESRLGAGGMGVVYRAVDIQSNRTVALKVLTAAGLADEKMRRRFRHEAVALSRLSHPNIARLIEFDSQDGIDFIAMEFVPGTPLRDRIARGPLREESAVAIASQVCDALAEAHRRGILHRDLKPANVMLTPERQVKLLDFGIARLGEVGATMGTVTGSMTESGQVVGTLAYMAPEVLRGERADERTDVYGVGLVLFEMLTGRRPFPDDQPHELMYMIIDQPPPRPSVLNGRISEETEAIVLRCLAKQPGDRPQQVAALRDSFSVPYVPTPGRIPS